MPVWESDEHRTGWTAYTAADNAVADAAKAGVAGQSHYLTSLHVGYSAAAIKTVTVLDGGATTAAFYVHNTRDVIFRNPIKATAGATLTVRLGASGTAGVIGAVVARGFTR